MSSRKAKALVVTASEGVTGYLTYVSRCGMSPAYSEYMLYGPVVRVAADKQWEVFSEEIAQQTSRSGDHYRIDFYFEAKEKEYPSLSVALEVKWIPNDRDEVSIEHDIEKLRIMDQRYHSREVYKFVMIAGVHEGENTDEREEISDFWEGNVEIPELRGIDENTRLMHQTVYPTRYTNYGCTVLEVSQT
ncbi:hypothetical protein [Salinibacter sp.]|jgi:hypothetical protein|uniref:hypothetical protein n=2 Tax=Salinibacter TaxID=146918 RepID=UPI0021E8CFE8|nr:hypothetical protein [Salinibacter sp.]